MGVTEAREFTFEVTSFFTIGFAPTVKDAWDFVERMPPEFSKKGHFTVDSWFNPKNGGHAIEWCCHALPQSTTRITTPYRVIDPDARF